MGEQVMRYQVNGQREVWRSQKYNYGIALTTQ